ncbi:hypothetical protein [Chitinibacter sp. S2-10]|uniref:hypothetical protein n=1 Tax=Chitinibacter sp. S2-10 TaxID=3373597 RepID=UPI0039778FC2
MTTTKKAPASTTAKPAVKPAVKPVTSPAATKKTTVARSARTPTATTSRPAKAAAVSQPLSPDAVMKIMALSKSSDSIELKLTVPLAEQQATVKRLKLDPVEAQPRQAFFFDTPDLKLFKAGLVVRARRIQGGRADTVIKLRPINPDDLQQDLRRSASFKVEVDLMPGGFVCSGSFKGACTGRDVLDATEGKTSLSSLFSKGQRAFFEAHAPAGIKLDDLVVLGPTFLLKAKHQPKDFPRAITVEMWLYPDGARILEVSTKCLPAETFQAVAEFKAYLLQCGIAVSESQETKTKTTLEYYSRQLKKA